MTTDDKRKKAMSAASIDGILLICFSYTITLLNIFLLEVNFEKSTIEVHFLLISFILAKFIIKKIKN